MEHDQSSEFRLGAHHEFGATESTGSVATRRRRRRTRRLRAVLGALTSAAAVLVIDVVTTLPDTDVAAVTASAPEVTRLHDTRSDIELSAGVTLMITVPGNHTDESVALNVTALNASGNGHVAAFDCGGATPTEWDLEYMPAPAIQAHLFVVSPDPDGHVCFASTRTTDLVIDHLATLS